MREHITLTKMLVATAPAAIVVVSFLTTDVMAGSATRDGKHRLAGEAAHAAFHRGHAAHREMVRGFGGSVHSGVPQTIGRGSGYVYFPGKGIVDEACNLPTSACPNELRDVR